MESFVKMNGIQACQPGGTPDDSILTGFRRLEDIVRKRLPPDAPNVRLFAQAFQSEKSTLVWKDVESGEQIGRGQLFTGAYT
jgi:hypothetical protein